MLGIKNGYGKARITCIDSSSGLMHQRTAQRHGDWESYFQELLCALAGIVLTSGVHFAAPHQLFGLSPPRALFFLACPGTFMQRSSCE
jgi:hypothetical protein